MAFADRVSFGNKRTATILAASFSTAQFFIETLTLFCLAVYVSGPVNTALKVFYAFAAIGCPLLLFVSSVAVRSIAKGVSTGLLVWLLCYCVVSVCELILTLIAIIKLDSLHDPFLFYNSAWAFAIQHSNGQLYFGAQNLSTCALATQVSLPFDREGSYALYLITQKGADGLIAAFALLLLFKNIFNVLMLIVGSSHYTDMKSGNGRRRRYSRTVINFSLYIRKTIPTFCFISQAFPTDPHHRGSVPQRRVTFSGITAVAR
ncbi:uncharacterized protein LOC108949454 isoform X1 [Ciona intestinalis]